MDRNNPNPDQPSPGVTQSGRQNTSGFVMPSGDSFSSSGMGMPSGPQSGYRPLPGYGPEDIHFTLDSPVNYADPWTGAPLDKKYTYTQNLVVRLNVFFQHYYESRSGESTLQIAFLEKASGGQTTVNSGPLMVNTENINGNRARGFYIEKVQLEVNIPDPAFGRIGDSPNDAMKSGSISSTMGWGVDASGGMMGEMPVISAGGSYSQSQTTTETYDCIEFHNQSDDGIKHIYRMGGTTSPHGSSYNNTGDLVWAPQFHKATLRGLYGEVSGDNLPIISQGSFTAPLDKWRQSGAIKVNIKMTIEMRLTILKAKNSLGEYESMELTPLKHPTVIELSIPVPWPYAF